MRGNISHSSAHAPEARESRHALRLRAAVQGNVQGVGFRPFVFRLAQELDLGGHVANSPAGVTIEAEGNRDRLQTFLLRIELEKPPLCRITDMDITWIPPKGAHEFAITASGVDGAMRTLVLPDVATCPDCLAEMHDPANRRFRYPFTNCTHCGPRFSIIERMPYDRPHTTMAGFELCAACRREYEDPADRRFHAQPLCCPECGPVLALWTNAGEVMVQRDDALLRAAALIKDGAIVAMKGVGGFLLLTDARNEDAVATLRRRKLRGAKPFALLWPGMDSLRQACEVNLREEALLRGPEAPIVILRRRAHAPVAANVSPDSDTLGVMLPYAPLHHLLIEELGFPIVATSGNVSDEPICIDEVEARLCLNGIADFFLVHDRPIARPVDDSVVRVVDGKRIYLRRARGAAPLCLPCEHAEPGVIAVGAHLKSTVALSSHRQLLVSPHIGDLETPQAFAAFARTCRDLRQLFDVEPDVAVCDLHPDYLSSRQAESFRLPVQRVQHHHAHVLSVMAEHHLTRPVLGFAWDGAGYGVDGAIWGGETLLVDLDSFRRMATLRPFRLPGGEKCMTETPRCALALLADSLALRPGDQHWALDTLGFTAETTRNLLKMIDQRINAPISTSMGRLFDAVAALLGVCARNEYEGQAAVRLESLARECMATADPLPFGLVRKGERFQMDWRPLVRALLDQRQGGTEPGVIAAAFHAALVEIIDQIADACGIEDVALTGGCFQNALLLSSATARLESRGYRVYTNEVVPPNDGGIALGQAFYGVLHRNATGRR